MMGDYVTVRLGIAVLLGALVGVERQWHHKTAGVKTHALVATGAAAFAALSELGLGAGGSPVQIAAGIVTGIGFIGGGVIMRRSGGVQGINTAATLWATGSLGLAVGGGHYAVASAVLLAILSAQIPLRWLASWIDKHSGPVNAPHVYRVLVSFDPSSGETIRSVLASFAGERSAEVSEHAESRTSDADCLLEAHVGFAAGHAADVRILGERLASLPGVRRTEWSKVPGDERE
jgi:putative Mg2+ transporter-C (MgtC) family protein